MLSVLYFVYACRILQNLVDTRTKWFHRNDAVQFESVWINQLSKGWRWHCTLRTPGTPGEICSFWTCEGLMASCCNFSLKSELYCVFSLGFFNRLLPPFKWNSPHSDPTSPSPGVSRICRQWIAATIRSRSGDALYVLLTVSESMQSKRSIS